MSPTRSCALGDPFERRADRLPRRAVCSVAANPVSSAQDGSPAALVDDHPTASSSASTCSTSQPSMTRRVSSDRACCDSTGWKNVSLARQGSSRIGQICSSSTRERNVARDHQRSRARSGSQNLVLGPGRGRYSSGSPTSRSSSARPIRRKCSIERAAITFVRGDGAEPSRRVRPPHMARRASSGRRRRSTRPARRRL